MTDKPVTFTKDAARRIAKATRQVERQPQHYGPTAGPDTPPVEDAFWARIGSWSMATGGYSWQRLIPIGNGGLRFDDRAIIGRDSAFDALGRNTVPAGVVVRLHLTGYDADGEPRYTFTYDPAPDQAYLHPHDHRDNFNGGFAFAVYHPGTALPHMPWAI